MFIYKDFHNRTEYTPWMLMCYYVSILARIFKLDAYQIGHFIRYAFSSDDRLHVSLVPRLQVLHVITQN